MHSSCILLYLRSRDGDVVFNPPDSGGGVAGGSTDNVHCVAHGGLDTGPRWLQEHWTELLICSKEICRPATFISKVLFYAYSLFHFPSPSLPPSLPPSLFLSLPPSSLSLLSSLPPSSLSLPPSPPPHSPSLPPSLTLPPSLPPSLPHSHSLLPPSLPLQVVPTFTEGSSHANITAVLIISERYVLQDLAAVSVAILYHTTRGTSSVGIRRQNSCGIWRRALAGLDGGSSWSVIYWRRNQLTHT